MRCRLSTSSFRPEAGFHSSIPVPEAPGISRQSTSALQSLQITFYFLPVLNRRLQQQSPEVREFQDSGAQHDAKHFASIRMAPYSCATPPRVSMCAKAAKGPAKRFWTLYLRGFLGTYWILGQFFAPFLPSDRAPLLHAHFFWAL